MRSFTVEGQMKGGASGFAGALWGYVGLDNAQKQCVVVFRGTSNWKTADGGHNLLTDLHAGATNANTEFGVPVGEETWVHRGFFNSFVKLKGDMNAHLSKLGCAGRKILFTGHSLGGALAMLAGVSVANNKRYGSSELSIYTFGAPRVGSGRFATLVRARAKRPPPRLVRAREARARSHTCSRTCTPHEVDTARAKPTHSNAHVRIDHALANMESAPTWCCALSATIVMPN